MPSPAFVTSNGNQVTWTIKVTNQGPNPNNGVFVQETLPAGMSYVSAIVSKGSYNSGTQVWTIGNLAVNETVTMYLTTVVTDINLAPFTNTAQVFGSTIDPDNSDNLIQEVVNTTTCPPAAGAVDDPNSCLCGNMATNDTPCTHCTTEWIIIAGSETNVVINTYSQLTGEYSASLIDPTLVGSFQYNIWCTNCPGGGSYQASGPATVTINPLFTTFPTNQLIKEDFLNLIVGNTSVNLSAIPIPGTQVFVYRNGLELPQIEWIIAGSLITFVTPFSTTMGGLGLEGVTAHYWIP